MLMPGRSHWGTSSLESALEANEADTPHNQVFPDAITMRSQAEVVILFVLSFMFVSVR